jgi:uncharacterized repeat protein (TIGR03833 family)
MNEGTIRKNIKPGTTVDIVLKEDQPTGKLTRGTVSNILTNSSTHPRGIKVRLDDGRVGRVQHIVDPSEPVEPDPNPPAVRGTPLFPKKDPRSYR